MMTEPKPIDEATYRSFLDNLIHGRRRPCQECVSELLERGVAIRHLYVDLFQRALYEVGTLWEANRISVATEHVATSIVESLFTLVYPHLFTGEPARQKAIVACPADEFHQVGGKMVADIMELNGWNSLFLGANTPLSRLVDQVHTQKPALVGLSLSISYHLPRLVQALQKLRDHFPELPLLVGGQAFHWCGHAEVEAISNVQWVPDVKTLESILRSAA